VRLFKRCKMTTDETLCTKAALSAACEIQGLADVGSVAACAAIQNIIVKHMLPLLKAQRAELAIPHATKKSSSGKGSSRANHYAFLHKVCSSKTKGYEYVCKGKTFAYQNNLDDLIALNNKTQLEYYYNLHDDKNSEQLKRFTEFVSLGDIHAVVTFIETECKDISQMSRTSLIWYQFMSPTDREEWKQWYKLESKDDDVLAKPYIKLNPTVKVAAILRKPIDDVYSAETDDEVEVEVSPEPDKVKVVEVAPKVTVEVAPEPVKVTVEVAPEPVKVAEPVAPEPKVVKHDEKKRSISAIVKHK
jgi:hypothetical protein